MRTIYTALTALFFLAFAPSIHAQLLAPQVGVVALSCGTDTTVLDNGGYNSYSDGCNSNVILYCSPNAFVSLSGSYAMECGYDNLYIRDGSTNGPVLWSGTCGGTFTLTGDTGQTLVICFYADGSVNSTGFEIDVAYTGACEYEILSAASDTTIACGTQLNFTDNGGPSGHYSNDIDHMVYFEGGGFHYLTIGGTYQLETGQDSMFLYNGIGDTGTVLMAASGSAAFFYTTAVGSSVTLRLKTNGSITHEGIHLTVKTYGSCNAVTMTYQTGDTISCGTTIDLFDSGGEWSGYNDGANDWMVIEATALTIITISGTYSVECGYDNIYIRSGAGPYGPVLAQYSCGGTMSYTGQPGQTLTVQLVTDGSVTGVGLNFSILYNGSCTEGNFPDSSGYTLSCGNSFTLYDDGGASGGYSDSLNSFVAFNSTGTGIIQLSGSYDLATGDTLYLVHGNATTHQTLATYTGNGSINYTTLPGMDVALLFHTDSIGNADGFAINVQYTGDCDCGADSIAPYFLSVVDSIVLYSASWGCGDYLYWNNPIYYDNCNTNNTITTNLYYGQLLPAGVTTLIYTISDGVNSRMDSTIVVVMDTIAPYLYNMPSYNTVATDPGICGAVYNWPEPSSSDNCAVDTVYSNYQSGDVLPVGSDTIRYTVVDQSGNAAEYYFVVTVLDLETPTIVCPNDTTICENVRYYYSPIVADNCSATWYQTAGLPPGSMYPAGTIVNCFTVTDGTNTTSTCFTVTVLPAPVVAITSAADTLCVDDQSYTLTATPAGGTFSGPFLNGTTVDPSITGPGTFMYYYNLVGTNGCTGTDSVSILVDNCTSQSEPADNISLSVYPNPATNAVRVLFGEGTIGLIQLFDLNGKLMEEDARFVSGNEFNLEAIPNGVYLLRIQSEVVAGSVRIIISR